MASKDLRFDERVGIVTGAGRGLGRGYALELAERGASLVLNDLGSSGAELETAVEECNTLNDGRTTAVPGDVSDTTDAAAIVDQAIEHFGRLDLVLNNAGIGRSAAFGDVDYDELMTMVRVHLGGHFAVTSAAWPHLVEQRYGRILMTGSNAGLLGMANASAYAAAKGGVIALAKTVALEGAELGVTCNVICPAAFTPMAVEVNEEYAETMREPFPVSAVTPVAAWLLHESCDVTGAVIDAKGGAVRYEFMSATEGVFIPDITAESVGRWRDRIFDQTNTSAPRDVVEADAWFHERKKTPLRD